MKPNADPWQKSCWQTKKGYDEDSSLRHLYELFKQ